MGGQPVRGNQNPTSIPQWGLSDEPKMEMETERVRLARAAELRGMKLASAGGVPADTQNGGLGSVANAEDGGGTGAPLGSSEVRYVWR